MQCNVRKTCRNNPMHALPAFSGSNTSPNQCVFYLNSNLASFRIPSGHHDASHVSHNPIRTSFSKSVNTVRSRESDNFEASGLACSHTGRRVFQDQKLPPDDLFAVAAEAKKFCAELVASRIRLAVLHFLGGHKVLGMCKLHDIEPAGH